MRPNDQALPSSILVRFNPNDFYPFSKVKTALKETFIIPRYGRSENKSRRPVQFPAISYHVETNSNNA